MTTPPDPSWTPDQGSGVEWPTPARHEAQPASPAGEWTALPPGFESLQPPPARSHGRLIAATAAAVVVIGGGVATYAAVSSSSAGGGAASPQRAVTGLLADLGNADLAGALNDLAPSERVAISKPLLSTFDSLKRNDVLKPDANLGHVSGLTFKASDVTFAGKTITINDHVQIVELTGGTLTIGAAAARLPLTADFERAIHAPATSATSAAQTTTIDIAKQVKQSGKPIRIAAQKSGGGWYPSVLYTIADNAATEAGLQAPAPADRIPNLGASSPDDAVRSAITALLHGDVERAIELTSPDELGVLHDYGKLVVEHGRYKPANVQLKDLQLADTPTSDGARVTLKSVTVAEGGHEESVSVAGSCFTLKAEGRTTKECAPDTIKSLAQASPRPLTPAQLTALDDVFAGVSNLGLDVTKTAGRYYLSPIRTYAGLANQLLSGLKGQDAQVLLKLIASLDR
ncbi:hypothetical protein [uncultured Jatrophihabitans sp.]|uniref:hypothetical protein n=1 Tax=uncultured Jatrophihabitans sp. TaxID=1610747 RepID=UPI0035CBE344